MGWDLFSFLFSWRTLYKLCAFFRIGKNTNAFITIERNGLRPDVLLFTQERKKLKYATVSRTTRKCPPQTTWLHISYKPKLKKISERGFLFYFCVRTSQSMRCVLLSHQISGTGFLGPKTYWHKRFVRRLCQKWFDWHFNWEKINVFKLLWKITEVT